MQNKNRHAIYDLEYHLVVVTKYRHPVFENEELKQAGVAITKRIFEENWNCNIMEINIGVDHIHILFDAPPQCQLSKLINNFKTVTSRLLRRDYGEYLSKYYWKPYFWNMSYYVSTVSERSHEVVKQYIRNQ